MGSLMHTKRDVTAE